MNKSDLLKYLKRENFSDKIIKAFRKIKREDFIPSSYKKYAYENYPIPIEKDATISQPYTIAFMLEILELKPGQKVMEIGSGSGYVLALISEITNGDTYGIEINKNLVESSSALLKHNKKIFIINKDGREGLPEKAPFDRILISASQNSFPEHLKYQLKDGGIIVAPIKNSIIKARKIANKLTFEEYKGFIFVPLKDY